MDTIPILIGVAVAAALTAAAYFLWKRNRKEPEGWYVGPLSNGENRSRGVKLMQLAGAVWGVLIQPGDDLHGITKARGPLRRGIRLRYRVVSEGLYPTEDPGAHPILTLYVSTKDNRWTLRDDDAFNRWYTTTPLPLTEGEHSFDVPFDPEQWHCVTGAGAAAIPDRFAEALADTGRVGLAFGYHGGRMHGLMTRQPVAFELLEWDAA